MTAQPPLIQAVDMARRSFPRGLEQAQGRLRFGMDALLLAAFAFRQCTALLQEPRGRQSLPAVPDVAPDSASAPELGSAPRPLHIAELGCGCGAALLAVLLAGAPASLPLCGMGMDNDAAQVATAERNAQNLGLPAVFHSLDLSSLSLLTPWQNSLPLILANPPYGTAGRASPHPQREYALRAPEALTFFCRAAAFMLCHGGRFCCIFPAARLPELVHGLNAQHLGLRLILPLQARLGENAHRVLVLARKNCKDDVTLMPPLPLHPKSARDSHARWSKEALAFCPYLADNADLDTAS